MQDIHVVRHSNTHEWFASHISSFFKLLYQVHFATRFVCDKPLQDVYQYSLPCDIVTWQVGVSTQCD